MNNRSLLIGLLMLAACSKQPSEMAGAPAPAPMASAGAQVAQPGQFLAYEHDVDIKLPANRIAERFAASRQACQQARYGECTVLEAYENGGDYPQAQLVVRIVPAGVDAFISSAAEGGSVGSRRTHAEDLAEAVQNNNVVLARLQKEHQQLTGFQQRDDLSVADMIALSGKLSEVEAQLQQAQQQAAQHARRIQTQKVTLDFRPPSGQSGRSEIREAVSEFSATLSQGIAWTIRAVAFLIPVLLVGLLLLKLALRLFRRRRP
ncbi:DUF4349 domain-containing protein [Pseudoxanthomonas dokdonensis]|uniref:DUF4349 domain-containing protein n=1 Tax=Pseudoxanthomonas dokdonensis TaxID=344882 RepID=A0A0R0CBZ2_9GAMM|nr:DUF4349 domain-containing protein [Pseudoxanthomonas dokdonensis]KRG67149.1 hypothetical protein ABB29_15830 [Pseudoxanthomonas dokdonensis]